MTTWVHAEFHGRLYCGCGNRIWISRVLRWDMLAYGGAIIAYPCNDWLQRFLYRHKGLKQWLRWHA